jgi:tetratricopeptide (TPR) repeat protein
LVIVAVADTVLQCIEEYRHLGDQIGEGKAMSNLATVLARVGSYTTALDMFQTALHLVQCHQQHDQEAQARLLVNAGHCHRALQQHQEALHCWSQYLQIVQHSNPPEVPLAMELIKLAQQALESSADQQAATDSSSDIATSTEHESTQQSLNSTERNESIPQ